jgi:hypothetical protein
VEPALVLRRLTLRFALVKVCLGAAFRGSRLTDEAQNAGRLSGVVGQAALFQQ